MNPIFECKALCKSYGKKQALESVNLSLGRGRIVGLLGPNGSGKTTLLKLAAGLLTPSSGLVLVDGVTPGPVSKEQVSYLPDRNYLSGWMTVGEILDMFGAFYKNFSRKKADEMLERLGLQNKQRFASLSKGNKEKVQLILVMSREAGLYLLDEPIGGVDPATRDYILSTIIGNYSENATVLISTHLISDVERVLDEFMFIADGKVTLQSSVDALREERGISVDSLFREVFRC